MSLSKRDKKHLWHPLSQEKLSKGNLAIAKAKGVYLWDEAGNSYIDAISSWYISVYGHCNPTITTKVAKQMGSLDQVVFSGFTHEPAVNLSEKLVAILPENQDKLFFSDNGSTTVEVALKMALQYYFNQGIKKDTFIAFQDGFHGDTFGAMSVSGLSVYNGPFDGMSLNVVRIPTPNGANNKEVLGQLEALIATHKVAGFVYEPLVQGAAAMKTYCIEGLARLLAICKSSNVLAIADEVMTGFGKTGTYFASDQLALKPDIMCLSKALTAGLMPMGITSCSQAIYNAFYSDNIADGFFHGHTYSANPLACAAAIAGIDLLTSSSIQDGIKRIQDAHTDFNNRIKNNPLVKEIRQIGVIFAIDLDLNVSRYGTIRDKIYNFFLAQGVYLRPLGNTIYLVPPYVIKPKELQQIYTTIESSLVFLSSEQALVK